MLLYNRQRVVCHELTVCGVWAAHRKGKLFVKWDYSMNKLMFTRGTAFADIRISGIIPREIIFWYWEIINFSVSGIDFSPLQSGNHSDEIRTALWRARPNCQLALPPVSLMGKTNTPFRWYSLAIRKSGRISSWKRRIEYVMWISNEYFVMIL